MATPETTEKRDSLYTTTWQLRRKELVDQVFKATPFFYLMSARGNRRNETGGSYIEESLIRDKNESIQWVGKGSTVSLVATEPLTTSKWDWKYITGHIIRYFQDDQMNRGTAQLISKVNADIDNALSSMEEELEIKLFGDGTGEGGMAMDGLGNIVAIAPTTGTVGGLNRVTYDWFRNNYKNMTGETVSTYLLKRMRTMYNDCGVYGAQGAKRNPNLILTTQAIHELYEEEVEDFQTINLQPGAHYGVGNLGYGALQYKGQPIVWSPQCPAYYMYFLNTSFLSLVVDSIEYMNLGEWRYLEGTPRDRVAHYMTVLNLTSSCPRKQGVIYNIGN